MSNSVDPPCANSAVSLGYYMRVPALMFFYPPKDDVQPSQPSWFERLVLFACAAGVLLIGISAAGRAADRGLAVPAHRRERAAAREQRGGVTRSGIGRRAWGVTTAFVLAALALACAHPSGSAPAPLPAPPPEPAIEIVPHARGESAAASLPLRVTVRMATEPDLLGLNPRAIVTREDLILAAQLLLASGALAALGCPICLSNAVVGAGFAVVYLPVAAALSSAERAEVARIEDQLATVDFAARADESLRRFVAADPAAPASAELLVIAYGFAPLTSDRACFFLDARLRVSSDSRASEGTILLGPYLRSDDAPPPHCALHTALDADGGRLTRRVAEESAEILAAIAAHRLGESP